MSAVCNACRSTPQPMTMVIGLRTRLHECMCTKQTAARQQPGSVVNSFIEQGEFEAIKTLGGHRALYCDKHQFVLKRR